MVGETMATLAPQYLLLQEEEEVMVALVLKVALLLHMESPPHLLLGARVVGPVPPTMVAAKIKMARLRAAGPCTLRSVAH